MRPATASLNFSTPAADATGMGKVFDSRAMLIALMVWLAGTPVIFLNTVGGNEAQLAPWTHALLVGIAAAVAAVAAVGLSIVGVRRSDGRTVLMSTAFSTMTALLAVHGIATPGVIVGDNGLVAFAGGISLPAGALILALTALPGLRRPRRVKDLVHLQIGLAVGILALGAVGLTLPGLVPGVPEAGSAVAVVLAVVSGGLFGVIAYRALRTFMLTRRAGDLIATVGCVWLGIALFPQLIMGFGTVGFYAGHGLEIVGVTMIAVPVVLDLIQGSGSRALVGDLSAAEIVMAEERFLGARVRALLVSLEQKDPSTERHTRRVALLAVRVGEKLRLPNATLRHLAMGGLLHDIGKLSVPDAVLRKPSGLTDEEFAEIKKHPGAGLKLLRELGGFPEQVLRLVNDHHERLDGSGYPNGIAGPELGIGPRLLAVCDVFDALTSDRVYRDAWTEADALALLRKDAGTKLDARCVHALEQVVALGDATGKTAAPTPATAG